MATNHVQPGAVIEYTASGSSFSSGDVVVIGCLVGVALVDIADGATGAVQIGEVFTLAKTAGTAWTQGAVLDYDISESEFHTGLSAATGDITKCGVAFAAAASAATTGQVLLTPGTGSITA